MARSISRVAFDARCLNTPHIRGMGKVLLQLLREGLRQTDWTFVLFGDEPRAPMHAPNDGRVISHVQEIRGHRWHAWEQIGLPWMTKRFGCDLLHAPSTWAPLVQPVPTVVTIHDTLPWTEDRPTTYLRAVEPAAYAKARRVVTPSESSRRDIVERWPVLASRTTVIQWAIDPSYLAPGTPELTEEVRRQDIRPPYLLYMGGEIPRKRLAWALRVWAALGDRDDRQLVLCGLQAPTERLWMTDVPSGMQHRVRALGFIPERAMPGLYANAEAVLYPTLYEGFGFPAIESQASGTPVLMSALGSLGELAGPGAVVLPANDFEAWVRAAAQASVRKQASAAAARRWAHRFTWADAWKKFQTIYEESV